MADTITHAACDDADGFAQELVTRGIVAQRHTKHINSVDPVQKFLNHRDGMFVADLKTSLRERADNGDLRLPNGLILTPISVEIGGRVGRGYGEFNDTLKRLCDSRKLQEQLGNELQAQLGVRVEWVVSNHGNFCKAFSFYWDHLTTNESQ